MQAYNLCTLEGWGRGITNLRSTWAILHNPISISHNDNYDFRCSWLMINHVQEKSEMHFTTHQPNRWGLPTASDSKEVEKQGFSKMLVKNWCHLWGTREVKHGNKGSAFRYKLKLWDLSSGRLWDPRSFLPEHKDKETNIVIAWLTLKKKELRKKENNDHWWKDKQQSIIMIIKH